MRESLHAEWTKLRTLASTFWLLLAGLAIQATTGLSSLPISPWAGLGVLAAWAAGSVALGGMLLRSRDA